MSSTISLGHIITSVAEWGVIVQEHTVREHLYILHREIRNPQWLVDTLVTLEVENHVARSPRNLIKVKYVFHEGKPLIKVLEHDSLGANNYKLSGIQIITGVNNTTIDVIGSTVYTVNDEVVIPDDIKFINCLTYKILAIELEKEGLKTSNRLKLEQSAKYEIKYNNTLADLKVDYKFDISVEELENQLDNGHVMGTIRSMGLSTKPIDTKSSKYTVPTIDPTELWKILHNPTLKNSPFIP